MYHRSQGWLNFLNFKIDTDFEYSPRSLTGKIPTEKFNDFGNIPVILLENFPYKFKLLYFV